ncbi:MAG TPA: peptidylprolyl isomerase [Geminicoccaceae bacterium]|nr:peptidylprolyl isomerase [Geminicoccus sp.]HMU51830.1 peptidylprolyl isomerase [Geminicoccaceae bacterium]
MRRLLLTATAVALCLAAPVAVLQAADPADPVVAKVDGAEIHKSEIDAAYAVLPDQYRQMPIEMLYDPLLQRVIDTRLLAMAAEKKGLADDPAVEAAIARAREATLRDQLIQRAITDGTTEAALKAAYEKAKGQPEFIVEEVHARHVLLDSEADARAVIAELDKGGDFGAIAKAKSKDPSAAQNDGDLGYFTREAMVPEFSTAAFAMQKGSWSKDPVQSQFGWHVILVEDKRTTTPSFADKEPELREQLSREILTSLLEDSRKGAEIERFNIDGTPRAPEAKPN